MSEPTIGVCYHLLMPKDKLILMGAINKHSGRYTDIDQATMAFVPQSVVLASLRTALAAAGADSSLGKRAYRELIQRLEFTLNVPKPGIAVVRRQLNDAKVGKWFGKNPERGTALRGHVKRVTVGFKNQFGRVTPDDNVLVPPMVALKSISKGTWQVTCEAKFLKEVDRFLTDNCM